MKRLSFIFVFAFITNIIWENLHAYLYLVYRGGEITKFILLRASFWDAVMISIILLPFLYFKFLKGWTWVIFIIGVVLALFIEWHALGSGRWLYNSFMPIIPILNVGLTPTIQLGLLGYLTFKFQEHI